MLPVLHLITLLQYIYRGKYRQTFINITQFYLFLYIMYIKEMLKPVRLHSLSVVHTAIFPWEVGVFDLRALKRLLRIK